MSFVFYIFLIALFAFIFLKYIFMYWIRKGFRNIEPTLIFGNLLPVIKKQRSFGTLIHDLYWESVASPYLGIYLLFRPALLVRDVKLVKRILTTDSAYFFDRGVYNNEKKDPMSANLFTMQGDAWKNLRAKLTPLFSSAQLKNMFETFKVQGDYLVDSLQVPADASAIVEITEKTLAFSLNNIASVFYGLDVNLFEEPNHQFSYFHKKLNAADSSNALRQAAFMLCPEILEFLNISFFSPEDESFVKDIIVSAIEGRQKHGVVRKDFLQLLFNLYKENDGQLSEANIYKIASQVALFYGAGSETTSGTISFCLYELCHHEEIMDKVCTEIDDVLRRHSGEITYDSIHEMSYLELCLKETMRKVPGLPVLNRQATKDYKIEETGQIIQKGTPIMISCFAMQNDPEYFKEPKRFMPERFLEENKEYITEDAYIPFGDGPRACIAVRMGKIAAKVALVSALSRFKFQAVDNQKMEFATHGIPLLPKNGIKLKVTNRMMNNNTKN